MSRLKKILLGLLAAVVAVAVLFVVCIGPWPVYSDSKFLESSYYQQALADIDAKAAEFTITDSPKRLQAGWGARIMTPAVGVPMGGYGGRPNGKRSTGVRDELMARAIAFNDGQDTVVLLGTDMLIVPPNVAELTITKVAEKTPLKADNIYFTASHTHCGPGGFAPGLAAKISGGAYDPTVPEFLSRAFADAIIEAYSSMKPAQLAHGCVDATQFVRNRARDKGAVDPYLPYMVVEQEGGRRCYVMRFSAHPTVFGQDMMEFTAEFPGEFARYVERQANASAVYLGGAVGSMSPRAPEGATPSERIIALGEALGKLVLEDAKEPEFVSYVDVASMALSVGAPAAQARPLSPKWRLSPIASSILGVPREGYIQGARIGDMLFIGLPFDLSGELAKEWREGASKQGWDLWATGFSAAYLGYLSPDRYYYDLEDNGTLHYETGLMSWLGPNSEAYFGALMNRMIERLGPAPKSVAPEAMAATS